LNQIEITNSFLLFSQMLKVLPNDAECHPLHHVGEQFCLQSPQEESRNTILFDDFTYHLLVGKLLQRCLLKGLYHSDGVGNTIRNHGANQSYSCRPYDGLEKLLLVAVPRKVMLEIVVGNKPRVMSDHRCQSRGHTSLIKG